MSQGIFEPPDRGPERRGPKATSTPLEALKAAVEAAARSVVDSHASEKPLEISEVTLLILFLLEVGENEDFRGVYIPPNIAKQLRFRFHQAEFNGSDLCFQAAGQRVCFCLLEWKHEPHLIPATLKRELDLARQLPELTNSYRKLVALAESRVSPPYAVRFFGSRDSWSLGGSAADSEVQTPPQPKKWWQIWK